MGLMGIGLGAPIATLGSLFLDLWFFFSGRWRVNLIEKRQAPLQAPTDPAATQPAWDAPACTDGQEPPSPAESIVS